MITLFSHKMPTTENQLFEKFTKLANAVRQDFKRKGVVLPSQKKDGSIQIGTYNIKKQNSAYYIKDRNDNVVVGPLNLAQTAVVIANDLALGRWPDHQLMDDDKWYGYKAFAEESALHIAETASKRKDTDRADFSRYRAVMAAEQKLIYKKNIDSRFNKLCKLT
jgi:hypothetical protein